LINTYRTPLNEGIKSQEDDPIQHGIQSRLLQRKAFLIVYWKNTPIAKFIVPDWEDKVDSDIGLSYRPASICSLPDRYDNPMPESTFSPSTRDYEFGIVIYKL
jgi:hypothetical protein